MQPTSETPASEPEKAKRKYILIGLIVIAIIAVIANSQSKNQPVVIVGTAVPPLPALNMQQASLGADLYSQNCAACHGANLEGAENWKQPLADGSLPPPPHDESGHTWHHPDFLLLEIMATGGALYDGVMPPFEEKLTYDERVAILTFIKSTWETDSVEYQWWVTNTYPTPTPEAGQK